MDFLSKEDAIRYQLLGEIGSGAFAKVFKAKDKKCSRFVAIKVLKSEPCHQMCERFHREVKTYLQAQHSNVVTLYDANLSADAPYLVMEYVDGIKLEEQFGKDELDLDLAISVVRQIGSALSHMHKIGLLHRDIKPANILVKKDGEALLTDFNLVFDEEATALTATGHIVGTPRYISPEQWYGAPATVQSDLYSLGMVFFELLCRCGNGQRFLQKPINPERPLPAIKTFVKDIPAELNDIVMRAVARSAKDRYKSVDDFLKALEGYLTKGQTKVISAIKPRKSETKERELGPYLFVTIVCFVTLFFLLGTRTREIERRPLICSFDSTIDGVLVRCSMEKNRQVQASLITSDGRKGWKQELRSKNKELQFIIPWKGWHPAGKLSLTASPYEMTTTCPSLKRFVISLPTEEYVRDGLLITWPTPPGFTALIEQNGLNEKRRAEYKDGQFECLIPTAQLIKSATKVRLLVEDKVGVVKATAFVKTPYLDLKLFWSTMAKFNEGKPLRKYYSYLRHYLKLRDGASKRQVLHKIRSDTNRLRNSIGLIIAGRSALLSGYSLTDSEKLLLFNELAQLTKIERIVHALDGKNLFFASPPYDCGDFAVIKKWPRKLDKLKGEKDVIEFLRRKDTQMITAIDGPQMYKQKSPSLYLVRDTVTRLILPMKLSAKWLQACGPRAGLLFRCSIDADNYIELKINGRASFIIWGQIEHGAGRLECAKEIQFPASLLQEGKNLIEMKLIAVLPKAGSIVLLKRITLLPNRLLQH